MKKPPNRELKSLDLCLVIRVGVNSELKLTDGSDTVLLLMAKL